MSSVTQHLPAQARILVVEDEGLVARDIQQTLEDLGYYVTGTVGSGKEALHMANQMTTDLVLMDVKIRGDMDGIDVADRLRSRFQLPVVYLTAHSDTLTLERAKITEPFGYIVKPFSNGELKASIEIALQRHRLQKEIEEKEAWLTAVLRSVGDAMIVTDSKGNITFFNSIAESLFGVTEAAVRGKRIQSVLSLEVAEADSLTELNAHDTTKGVHFATGSLLRPDGQACVVVSSFSALRKHAESEPYGMVIVLRDISTIEKTEQALRETNWFLTRSNEQLNQLAYSLSHDLQDPLGTILMASDLLAKEYEGPLPGSAERCLGIIQKSCNRMRDILTSLLDYYRSSNGEPPAAALVDLSLPLTEALLNLQPSIQKSGAKVEVDEMPLGFSHPVALWQIFQNLIGNAIKYGGNIDPRIQVSARRSGEFWVISVADNGWGFDASQSEKIFGLFQRAHGREITGSGIGLATCRKLVEHYGGRIWAESKQGQGATFHFTVAAQPADSLE